MAYRLSDGRFLTLVREGSHYVWYLLESDGTVITKTTMYMIVAAPQKFVVSEEDDGSFSVLSEDNQYLCYYEYDANSNSLEFKRMYDQSNRDGSRWLDLDTAQYLGNGVYYGSSYQGTVRLDMKNGTLNEYELRTHTFQARCGAFRCPLLFCQALSIPVEEALYAFLDVHLVVPAQAVEFADVDEFAHGAVGLCRVEFDRSRETNDLDHQFGEGADGQFVARAHVDMAVAYFA